MLGRIILRYLALPGHRTNPYWFPGGLFAEVGRSNAPLATAFEVV